MTQRESMAYDVVIVGAGPSGLSASIRLAQLAQEQGQELTICVVEKGSEVGAHILSGAVIETRALDELLPDWQALEAPLTTPVIKDELYLLQDQQKAVQLPGLLIPKTMHNAHLGDKTNYVVSLGNLCRWLGQQAEALGVEIYPGFAAAEVVFNDDGAVAGVTTGDMGVAADGQPKEGMYTPGMNLLGKYTIFAECPALRYRPERIVGCSGRQASTRTGVARCRLAINRCWQRRYRGRFFPLSR